VEGAIRTRHLNIWKPRGFVQLMTCQTGVMTCQTLQRPPNKSRFAVQRYILELVFHYAKVGKSKPTWRS
jgi:hypothetical protein